VPKIQPEHLLPKDAPKQHRSDIALASKRLDGRGRHLCAQGLPAPTPATSVDLFAGDKQLFA
jgi:hypothetical protein